jgi:arylsulfatase
MLSRRWARRALAPSILALSACASEGDATRPDRRPNVLLIVVDALRSDTLGVNGYPLPTTPRLDRLAAEGVSLPRAHAHSTWTKPSMATLFTSLYPPQHGLDYVAQDDHGVLSTRVLLDEVHTLAESLAGAGYQTAGVLDQVHLQDRFGFRQGFADYADLMGTAAPELNRQLFRWWEAKGREPFFAYVHYLDAHWPYTHRVRDQDRLLFGPPHLPARPPRSAGRAEAWAEGLSAPEVAALRARYDAEVSWVDAAIGALLDELETRGLLADTLVVVTADHGEAFMEHGRIMHGHEPHRELTHVPLILRPPTGWTPFAPVEEVVGLVDVMPTLLDLLGLEAPAACQGRSFAPALRGEPLAPQPHYAEGAGAVAVRTRDLTLLYRDTHRYELFDTRDDPGETTPVLWPCAGPCERLLRGADTYRERMERRVGRRGRVLETLTAEDLAALRALGYL